MMKNVGGVVEKLKAALRVANLVPKHNRVLVTRAIRVMFDNLGIKLKPISASAQARDPLLR